MSRFAQFMLAVMAAATVALAFTSFASPLPISLHPDMPFALEAQAPPAFQSPPFLLPSQAQPQAPQVQAPAPPTAPVAVAPGTTVSTTGNVQSDTKISLGTFAGDLLSYAATAFLTVIGTTLTAVLVKILGGIGANITAGRQAQLQKLVERGVILAAAGAKKTLDGKITVDVKNQVVSDAIRYAQVHGADLIKKLGEHPTDAKTVEGLAARAETALADPAVPVEVAPAPAVPAPSDLKSMIRDQLMEVIKEMRESQVAKA